MGTRSLTVFNDKDGEEIAVMYRQHDGYPEGHGKELATFLSGKKIINGFSNENNIQNSFNGMSCLAAAVVAHFKNESGLGGIYLFPPETRNADEEYIYYINGKEGEVPTIKCYDVYEKKEFLIKS